MGVSMCTYKDKHICRCMPAYMCMVYANAFFFYHAFF